MADIVELGIRAGALGFTTSRTLNHRSSTGEPTPSLTAARDELVGIARGVGRTGTGVLQVVSDLTDVGEEFGHLRAMAEASGRPVSFSLVQDPRRPDGFRKLLGLLDEAADDGLVIRGQVATRAIRLLLGLTTTLNPLMANPIYREIAGQPLGERLATMRSPEFKRAVLEADATQKDPGVLGGGVIRLYRRMFVLGDPPETTNRIPTPASRPSPTGSVGTPSTWSTTSSWRTRGGRCCTFRPSTLLMMGSTPCARCCCTPGPSPA